MHNTAQIERERYEAMQAWFEENVWSQEEEEARERREYGCYEDTGDDSDYYNF